MLVDEKALDYEVEMLGPEGKVVLEIGGGTGNLSRKLAEKSQKLIIVEKDPLMVDRLMELFHMGDLNKESVILIEGDFLDLSEKEIKEKAGVKKIDLIISNVPYIISSALLFKLTEFKFEKAILCLQKEFVDRMVAKEGEREWSRLSVMVHLYFKPVFLRKVKKGAFRPVPAVDSAMVMVSRTKETMDKTRDKFIERLFSHRKNTVKAALKAREMKENYSTLRDTAEKYGLLERRVFSLRIKEILQLAGVSKE